MQSDLESRSIQKLIDVVLQQSNLKAQLKAIFDAVEEDLSTQYTEEELTAEGQIYMVYRALDEHEWTPELEVGLTEAQKEYLSGLCRFGHIEMSVMRRDCEHYLVSIPLEFKNAVSFHHPKFTFTLSIESNLDASVIHQIKGTFTNINSQEFCKVVAAL